MAKFEQQVAAHDDGNRTDAVLAAMLDISKQEARRLLTRGGVMCNGHTLGSSDKGRPLTAGDRIAIEHFEREAETHVIPQPELELRIIAEATDWVVVDKPVGRAVHPLEPGETDTLLNAVIARYPQIHSVGEGGLRSGVVHRLDLETSGLVAFALNQETWQALRQAFRDHTITKRYRARVIGQLEGSGEEIAHLCITQHRPARVRIVPPDTSQARRCTLKWRAIESTPNSTLVEIDLGTGFLHQIRAMFANLGHPVLGDPVYGQGDSSERLMLHATELHWRGVAATSPAPFS